LSCSDSKDSLPSTLEPAVELLPASRFSLEDLTAAYNQTRVDYLVPMPMNAARLAAYIDVYNVSLPHSVVAVEGDQILGLGMLGVRSKYSWITRLGVLPVRRRRGTGEAIMRGLLEASQSLGLNCTILEVIKGNTPAYELFRKLGFQETHELLILRRPPGKPPVTPEWMVTWLDQVDAIEIFRRWSQNHPKELRPAWTNQIESLQNSEDLMGLQISLDGGGRGWMIFRRQKFLLSHFIFHTEFGDPVKVGEAMLSHLYQRFPLIDTYTENLVADDPHLPALIKMGFIEAFRRIEMERFP